MLCRSRVRLCVYRIDSQHDRQRKHLIRRIRDVQRVAVTPCEPLLGDGHDLASVLRNTVFMRPEIALDRPVKTLDLVFFAEKM